MSPARRQAFVVHVHEHDPAPVVENVRTRERVLLPDLAAVGPQIERWLSAAGGSAAAVAAGAAAAPAEPAAPQPRRFSRPSGAD